MMSNFILTCADVRTLGGSTFSAVRLAHWRLEQKGWPLYPGTQNRKAVKDGDRCVIYLSSRIEKFKGFTTYFTVSKVDTWRLRSGEFDPEELGNPTPELVVRFSSYKELPGRVPIESMVPVLDFF